MSQPIRGRSTAVTVENDQECTETPDHPNDGILSIAEVKPGHAFPLAGVTPSACRGSAPDSLSARNTVWLHFGISQGGFGSMKSRRIGVGIGVVGALILAACSSGGSSASGGHDTTTTKATNAPSLTSLLLTEADVPAGWTVASSSNSSSNDSAPDCLKSFESVGGAAGGVDANFQLGTNGPQFGETLRASPGTASDSITNFTKIMDGCKTFSVTSGSQKVSGTIAPLSFPHVGDKSSAFTVTVSSLGFTIAIQIVAAENKKNTLAVFSYSQFGSSSTSAFHQLINDAMAKVAGKVSPDYGSNAPKEIGQPAQLNTDTANASVTAVRVVDPAQSSNQYETPGSGNRYVGVEFKITNTGSTAFQPEPDSDTTIIDSQAHSYSSKFADLVGCPSFASSLTLTAGEAADGCVTFAIPTGAVISKIQFTAQSGGTAEWDVG